MKNVFLMLVLVISFASVDGSVRIKPKTTDQYSWEEHAAANLWQRSAPLNRELLKWNRGFIYPGDWLIFAYPQMGDSLYRYVRKGDYPLGMSKNIVITQPQKENAYHGEPYANSIDEIDKPSALDKFWQGLKEWLSELPWYIWVLILFLGGWLISFITSEKRRNADPVTAGPPQIPGGVRDEEIESVVLSRHPGAQILSKVKGRLFGKGTPHYNFRRISLRAFLNRIFRKTFNGTVGYQMEIITPEGQRMLVQTLMGCGNEIMMNGKFLTGVTFIPDPEQPEIFKPTPEKKVETLPIKSELTLAMNEQSALVARFMKSQLPFKITTTVVTAEGGSVTTIIEANRTQKNESSEGKKK